ncbi:reverse transcriptase [Plakobranchus ocellatus]|uniref:Reverse transcriptase n=1 Tax=Plakobranchus ocellatus TaxID=259542 RepID=A0AAV4BZ57_9GAST|nr:reverse transcriptase [Plakobranchus ocellatus]
MARVPTGVKDVALYCRKAELRLPLKSIAEMYKNRKATLMTMLKDSDMKCKYCTNREEKKEMKATPVDEQAYLKAFKCRAESARKRLNQKKKTQENFFKEPF